MVSYPREFCSHQVHPCTQESIWCGLKQIKVQGACITGLLLSDSPFLSIGAAQALCTGEAVSIAMLLCREPRKVRLLFLLPALVGIFPL